MSLKVLKRVLTELVKRWVREEEALAAVESAMIFPIMLTLLLGVFDVGNGILANQKAIRASQVVADLIAREASTTTNNVNEAIEAGRLAFEPIDSTSYGVDIISMRFTEDDETEIVWRQTQNMTPIANPMDQVEALSTPGEGVVMVAVKYTYEPVFAGFVTHNINMQEVAFSRGRKSAVVNLE